MRAFIVLIVAFLLLQYLSPLLIFLRGGLGYDAARHGEVVLLSTARCPYCRQMRELLWAGGVPYRELDVERDAEGARRFRAVGGVGVPVLIVADRVVRGYDPGAVREAFAGAAQPAPSGSRSRSGGSR